MRTDIYPTHAISGRSKEPIQGFYVGDVFIPMSSHKGQVVLVPTASGKGAGFRLTRPGHKFGQYESDEYYLDIKHRAEPVTTEEVFRVCSSCDQRLVVVKN